MSKVLFREGRVQVLAPDLGSLSTREINYLINDGGDNSWFSFLLRNPFAREIDMEKLGYYFLKANKFFSFDIKGQSAYISGTGQTFLRAYRKIKQRNFNAPFALIFRELKAINPILFSGIEVNNRYFQGWTIQRIRKSSIPKDLWLNHVAVTIKFKNISSWISHEENSNIKELELVLPYSSGRFNLEDRVDVEADAIEYSYTCHQFTNLLEAWYKSLRKKGLPPEGAGQWLPRGTSSEITQTRTLEEWRSLLILWTSINACPEKKFLAGKIIEHLKRIYGDFFKDFRFRNNQYIYIGRL